MSNREVRQAIIEDKVGITSKEIADYISARQTSAAKNAYSLLAMQVNFMEEVGMTLLRCAVRDCKNEIKRLKGGRP